MQEYWENQLKDVTIKSYSKELLIDPRILGQFRTLGTAEKNKAFTPTNKALLSAFFKVFKKLPIRQQEALCLYFGLGGHDPRTLEEVGKLMGVSMQNAHILVNRGKTQLKTRINLLLKKEAKVPRFVKVPLNHRKKS